jgi:hypothetical protein
MAEEKYLSFLFAVGRIMLDASEVLLISQRVLHQLSVVN